MSLIFQTWSLGTIIADVVLIYILASMVLVLILQATGIIRKVPYSYSVRNLIVCWRTTLLTGLAFTLVVGVMTILLSFVNAMYRLTEASGNPSNVIVLANGATDEVFSNLGFGDIKKLEQDPRIARDEAGNRLASWEVYVVVNQPIAVRKCPKCGELVQVDRLGEKLLTHGNPECPGSGMKVLGSRARRFIQVRGIEDPVVSGVVHGLQLKPAGSWFNQAGVQPIPGSKSETSVQAIIGEGLARELGPDQGKKSLEVGDYFDLGPRKWIVVGIMNSGGSTFDSEVWAKSELVRQQFGKSAYSTCVIRTDDKETAQELAADLSVNWKEPAVRASVETTYYASLNTTNLQFLIGTIIVVVIMAIGGVFGIMNTMFAAISQRTKDIGVLRILGFAPWQVLVSFFFEAILLALLGGMLGCLIGYTFFDGRSTTSSVSSGGGGGKSIVLKLIFDFRVLGAGMIFSLVLGCIGGLLPALSAMRLKPLDAVR